jgi:hypothetical protein
MHNLTSHGFRPHQTLQQRLARFPMLLQALTIWKADAEQSPLIILQTYLPTELVLFPIRPLLWIHTPPPTIRAGELMPIQGLM